MLIEIRAASSVSSLAVRASSRASPLPQGFVLYTGFVYDINHCGEGLDREEDLSTGKIIGHEMQKAPSQGQGFYLHLAA